MSRTCKSLVARWLTFSGRNNPALLQVDYRIIGVSVHSYAEYWRHLGRTF